MAARFRGLIVAREPLAHSARDKASQPQTYRAHIAGAPETEGVRDGARRRAAAMLRYHRDPMVTEAILAAVTDAATFHDLGKLDPLTKLEGVVVRDDDLDAIELA